MAKVSIKSEKITPFGGIFHVREHFPVLWVRNRQSAGSEVYVIRLSVQRDCWFAGKCLFLRRQLRGGRNEHDDDVHRIVLIRPPWAECSALCPQLALCSLMHAQKKQRFCQDGVPLSRVLRVQLRRLPLQYVGSRPSTAD